MDLSDLPNVLSDAFSPLDIGALTFPVATHPPRILMLCGSLRVRSYSRFLMLEAARILETFGAEVRIFNPSGLPLPDDAPAEHPKVQELRELSAWSEGHVGAVPSGMDP